MYRAGRDPDGLRQSTHLSKGAIVAASPTERRFRNAGLWLVLLAALAISITPILAPAVPHAYATDQFSTDRAIDHVRSIALRPHPMGTTAGTRVREYLVATLLESGIEPELQTVEAPDYFGAPGGTVAVTNVLARIRGSGDGEAILLKADVVPAMYTTDPYVVRQDCLCYFMERMAL